MNYVSVVIGIFGVLLGAYWIGWGRKEFEGPRFEVIIAEANQEISGSEDGRMMILEGDDAVVGVTEKSKEG